MAMTLAALLSVAQGTMAQRPQVEIRTTLGVLVVELYNETPRHRDNFLTLVKSGFYDSLLFHRVIPGFMVQGGDPGSKQAPVGTPLGSGGPGYTVPAEIVPGAVHKKGALAAAPEASGTGSGEHSSGSQFYIVHGRTYEATDLDRVVERRQHTGIEVTYSESDERMYAAQGGAPHLDGAYTVFGEVVEGLDVIDRIAMLSCDGLDRPTTDVRMFMRVIR